MNFYVLPKSNNQANIFPTMSYALLTPFLSGSFYTMFKSQFAQIKSFPENIFEIVELMNPYLSVSKMTHLKQKFPVSKFHFRKQIMFSFVEVLNNLRFYTQFKYVGECAEDFQQFIDFKHDAPSPKITCYEINVGSSHRDYINNCVKALDYIATKVAPGDAIVINLDHLFLKTVVDFVYILTSLFTKVAIVKPSISNPTSFEKFLVCQDFQPKNREKLIEEINTLKHLIESNFDHLFPSSLVQTSLPAYFLNKMEDIIVIFGQQQLETLNQVITIASSKSKQDKIESLQKQSVQKSVQWCEKHDVPCHKFADRANLFKENMHAEELP